MNKKIFPLAFVVLCLSGCSLTTTGESSREIYIGVRTKQHSETPAKVEYQSTIIDKYMESLTDGKTTKAE